MNDLRSDVSALIDNELEDHAVRDTLTATICCREQREAWRVYAMIGDHLRGDIVQIPDITADVMSRLHDEPVVLAPRNLMVKQRQNPLLALAASVAGVAMVGWLALSGMPDSPSLENRRLASSTMPTKVKLQLGGADAEVKSVPAIQVQHDMNEYLLAHQIQSSPFRLGHSAEHVRTVALTGNPPPP